MRIFWMLGSLVLLNACSSYSVHCNKHLRAINVPDRTVSTAPPSPATSPASPQVDASARP